MFFRRGVAKNDHWLEAKVWLFSIGALLALLGMLLENDWLMGAAGVVLIAGFALRFAGGSTDADSGERDGADPDNSVP